MARHLFDFACRLFSVTSPVLVLGVFMGGCADLPVYSGKLSVLTTTRSQPLKGAMCVVYTDAGKWTATTPGVVTIGKPAGDLRVVCNKDGYRTSELIYKGSSRPAGASKLGVGVGGGSGGTGVGISFGVGMPLGGFSSSYPSEVVVDMTATQ